MSNERIKFGKRVELMTDNYLIEKNFNLRFVGEKPEMVDKVIGFDESWENIISTGCTVIQEEDGFKLYYRGWPSNITRASKMNDNDDQTGCIAYSKDGIHYTKPILNQVDWEGSTENNIFERGAHCHNFMPFLDKNPNCKPDEKYKAICGTDLIGGIFSYCSADGIHWRKMAEEPVITGSQFDSMNYAFYDTAAGCYRAYFRYFTGIYEKYWEGLGGMRAIESCTSDDFIHWSEPVPNNYLDRPFFNEHLYTNATHAIPGAEHMLVSFPMRFHETRQKLMSFNGNVWDNRGISDMIMMTSRDGHNWSRVIKDAWIFGTLDPHDWAQRSWVMLPTLVDMDGYFYFYCVRNYAEENDGLWAYRVPRFRLAGLYGDSDGGYFISPYMEFETDDIYLNYASSAYGSVVVEVFDKHEKLLGRSEEMFGNELSGHIHLEGITGKEGKIRVTLREATLYAIGSKMD